MAATASADLDRACITVDLEDRSVADGGDGGNAEYGGDAKLACDDRGVTLHGSGVAHDSGRGEEEWCPGGVGDRTNQDFARLEATWIVRVVDDVGGARCAPAADGDAREHGACRRDVRLGFAALRPSRWVRDVAVEPFRR